MCVTCGFVDCDVNEVDDNADPQNPEGCDCEQNGGQEDPIEDRDDGEAEGNEELCRTFGPQLLLVVKHRRDHQRREAENNSKVLFEIVLNSVLNDCFGRVIPSTIASFD